MKCHNYEDGCFHNSSVHLDKGRCLVKGCKCKKFVSGK